MAGLMDPNKPALMQGGGRVLDPNKPALTQSRGGVTAAQQALEKARLAELAKEAAKKKPKLGTAKPTPRKWTGGLMQDGWGPQTTTKQVLGALGKGANAAQLMLYSGAAEAPERTPELTPEQVASMEADAKKAASTIDRVNKGVVARTVGRKNEPISLLNPNGVTVQETPEAQQAKAVEVENQRQIIEKGAKEQLRSNQLSRTKAAEEVVKTDLENRGVSATAEEKQKLVASEVENMRRMDNNQLAKYLSYALMGVGFLAGGTSRRNGEIWANSFRAGYDDVRQQAALQHKMAFEERKLAQENAYRERDLLRKERDTDSNIEYRAGRTDLGYKTFEHNVGVDGRRLDQGDSRLAMERERLELERDLHPLRKENLEARTAASKASAKKAAEIDKKGASITSADAREFVTAGLRAEGYKVDEKTLPVIAETYRQYQAANSGANPQVILRAVLKQYDNQGVSKTEEPWLYGDDKYGLGEGLLFNE